MAAVSEAQAASITDIEDILQPLRIDLETAHKLSLEFYETFQKLSAESRDQFLPTPVSELLLRPVGGTEQGRYLAIDIGGTNLRVGFVELPGKQHGRSQNGVGQTQSLPEGNSSTSPLVKRVLEHSWPILDQLKIQNAKSLFAWIGQCIASTVKEGCETLSIPRDAPLPMGVTFSFPISQKSVTKANLMAMGKGFAISGNLDLGSNLIEGYESARTPDLPHIEIAAITNDAVATLISFIYQAEEDETHKAALGIICGTGSNATIPLHVRSLHPSKWPETIKVLDGEEPQDVNITVNTEWSISGSAPPLHKLGLVSQWDTRLDREGEAPGFQPLEYMTAGRYLGELGRLMLLEYLTTCLKWSESDLPSKLQHRFGLTTTFLSRYKPPDTDSLVQKLESEFPAATASGSFAWSTQMADALYRIAKAIEIRAAGIVAAAVIGLLACAGDIPFRRTAGTAQATNGEKRAMNLIVGYTGGCIVHFQDYLVDCQQFLDQIIEHEFGDSPPVRVSLSPCHDGGITGAAILMGAMKSGARDA